MAEAGKKVLLGRGEAGGLAMSFAGDDACQGEVFPGRPGELALACHQCLMTALAFLPRDPARVCLVGLGPAALPRFLRRLYPDLHMDLVELDPEVVEMALGPFGFRPDPAMSVHLADGRGFLEEGEGRYDLIVLDAFLGSTLPYRLATRDFLETVKARLLPGGVAAANLPARPHNRYLASILAAYSRVFPRTWSLDVPGSGNLVVLAMGENGGKEAALSRALDNPALAEMSFDAAGLIGELRPLELRRNRTKPLTDIMLRRDAAPGADG